MTGKDSKTRASPSRARAINVKKCSHSLWFPGEEDKVNKNKNQGEYHFNGKYHKEPQVSSLLIEK